MSEKIGIGIITCNRPEFLKKLLNSVGSCNWAEFIIVNDGNEVEIDGWRYYMHHNLKQYGKNLGVGKSKNIAMKHLLEKGCDYIFLIEDDMLIKDEGIFNAYINAYKETGLHHLMFAYHGPANKANISGGKPMPRKIIEYNNCKISLNQHCVGSFCFYTRECLEKVGLNDERFLNAFEHVEHSYRLAQNEFTTPYWWWPDLANSLDYIEEQECSEKSSSIRPRSDWRENIQKSAQIFYEKHGMSPIDVPDKDITEVINFLRYAKVKSISTKQGAVKP